MSDELILARLLAAAEAQGTGLATLRAVVEEASAKGAEKALSGLGLADERAPADLLELRELLSAWRDAKRTARNEVVGWLVRIMLMLLLLGLAVKLGLVALVRG